MKAGDKLRSCVTGEVVTVAELTEGFVTLVRVGVRVRVVLPRADLIVHGNPVRRRGWLLLAPDAVAA